MRGLSRGWTGCY